jgi:hypothetical protein
MHAPRHRAHTKAVAATRSARAWVFMALSGLSFILLCIARAYP